MKHLFESQSRTRIFASIIIVVMIIFVLRLFYLQIIRHDYYVSRADTEQLKLFVLNAERGKIYAKDGSMMVPLVLNETVYTVAADPQIISKEAETIAALKEIAGGNTRPGFEELLKKKDSRYQVLATKLTLTQANKLKEKGLAGIVLQAESQRVYPEGDLAAQVLGFVNNEGDGNYGVEGGLNKQLKGVDGQLKTVVDVRYVPLTIGDQNINTPAVNGDDVVLSIDRNIQSHATEALVSGMQKAGATEGSVIVMDPNTGKVLAMANAPSYNPEQFTSVSDVSLFNNPIISDPYEPASVMKTFAFAAGIDKGVVSPSSTYYNTDSIQVYDRTIHNAYTGLTGTLTMQDVLNNSLNTGTVTLAQRLGDGTNITKGARDILYNYYHDRFRLGEVSGIELANESLGTIISPDNVEGNAVRYANMTFGQGLNVTMLQVATGFSAMVNGGTYYQPSIVDGIIRPSGTYQTKPAVSKGIVVSQQTSAIMRQMTQAARQSVSYMRDADRGGYTVGGKTGTAETIKNGVYVKTETVGTYLGYGGTDSPEYVIMVRVAAPGKNLEGGIHASPIFTDISNWLIDYLQLPPKG